MLYVKVKEDQLIFPYTFNELRADNPNTSFPEIPSNEDLAAFNVFPVKDIPYPENIDFRFSDIERSAPYYNGIEWVFDWLIIPKDLVFIEQTIRGERSSILKDTDWTQIPDVPVNKQAWADYRQALRDIPQQPGFPGNVIWPEQPSLF